MLDESSFYNLCCGMHKYLNFGFVTGSLALSVKHGERKLKFAKWMDL